MSSVQVPAKLAARTAVTPRTRPLRIGLMAALHDEISAFLADIQARHAAGGDAMRAEVRGSCAPALGASAGHGQGAARHAQNEVPGLAPQPISSELPAAASNGDGAESRLDPCASPFVPGTHQLAGRQFHCLRWHGLELVVVLAGVGKVAAATTASLLADRFGVQAMAFTGVAGGLASGVQVGDVVLAQQLLQHDMDASPLFPRHEVPLTGISRFAAEAGLSASMQRAALALLADLPGCVGAEAMTRYALQQARVHQGLIVSGDRFVATNAEREALLAELPDALAVEMEGAAVAQV